MLFHMIIQMSLGWKWLQAPGDVAMIGLLPSMNSKMSLKIAFLIEGSLAFFIRTHVLFLTKMSFQMYFKSLLSAVGFIASLKGALELFNL
jgi:hypothetical protein